MKRLNPFALLWQITATNHLGWPTERRHRITGHYQHRLYFQSGDWLMGRLPSIKEGPHGRR